MAAALTLQLPAMLRAQPVVFTNAEQGALADLGPQNALELPLRRGWFRSKPITYYDIGVVPPGTGTVTIPVDASDTIASPRLAPGARPIFSSLPGLPAYSGVWLVQYLVLAEGVSAEGIRDARAATAMVLRGDARFQVRRTYVNLPILPAGSFLAGDSTRRLQSGWYRGVEVRFFDFGVTDLGPAPIHVFVRGIDRSGPRFVREQHNIVDVVPGDTATYTDLWDVRFVIVDERFIPQVWRSERDMSAGARVGGFRILPAGELRNCPIVTVDNQIAARTPVPWRSR